jgi:hypothetical protein
MLRIVYLLRAKAAASRVLSCKIAFSIVKMNRSLFDTSSLSSASTGSSRG